MIDEIINVTIITATIALSLLSRPKKARAAGHERRERPAYDGASSRPGKGRAIGASGRPEKRRRAAEPMSFAIHGESGTVTTAMQGRLRS